MFAKLATVIVVLGAMFGALLVNRQQRIDAASEISRLHFEIERDARERIRLEAEIATAVRPERIAALLVESGLWQVKDWNVKNGMPVRSGAPALRPIPFRSDPTRASDEALSALELRSDAEPGDDLPELGG